MFGAFSERVDSRTKRRMAASLAVSLVLYGGLGTAMVVAANAVTPPKPAEKAVDVTFYKAVPEPPPAPEPPPPPVVAEPPPVAPPPPPDAPPPPPPAKRGPKAPKTPDKMPDKPADEANPTDGPKPPITTELPDQWGSGDPNGADEGSIHGHKDGHGPLPDKPPEPPAPPPPVVLPAGASAPEPLTALVTEDDYPRAARAARIEGTVIVKVAVLANGSVELVKFIKRDANFDDAVLAILKRLRFKPALYNGHAIAVYQNLKFPFTMD